jgi:hypothetical protein
MKYNLYKNNTEEHMIISQEKPIATQKSGSSHAAPLEIPKHLAEVANIHQAALWLCQAQLACSRKFKMKI